MLHVLIVLQEVPTFDLNIPTRLEVAASSCPRQVIVTALKKRGKDQAGQPYKPSKCDSVQSSNINWRSPTFWPIIDQAVREHVGTLNLASIFETLQQRDVRFKHFRYQQLSDWRDRTCNDRIVWSDETLEEVRKRFLPGGQQTCFNVFVSFVYTLCRLITNNL